MNILVCIKQVPGTSNVEIDPETGVLKRDGVESKLNPYDLFAIELGLRLRKEYGGSVSVITMGPPQAKAAVMEAVCMGADSGCVLSDRRFAGADVLATSYTLSQGIRRMGAFDLIICGKQTTDGDTAQVGPEIAEFIGIPHVTNVTHVLSIEKGMVTLRVNLDSQVVTQRVKLPVLICADADINTPRLPSYKRRRDMKDATIELVSLSDLEDKNEACYGLRGSATQVQRIFPPSGNSTRQILEGDGGEMAEKLYQFFKTQKYV